MRKRSPNRNVGVRNPKRKEITFWRYYWYFYNMALARFEWKGLPDEIVPRKIEEYLIESGQCAFTRNDVTGKFAVMKVNLGGNMDIYNMPERRYMYANQYFTEKSKSDSVLILDSFLGYPLCDYISMYADTMTEIRISRDINVIATRTPVLISGTRDTELSVKNAFRQVYDGVPFIPVRDDFGGREMLDSMKVLDTDAPIYFDKLHAELKQEKSELLTLLGIANTSENKKERAITGEISSDNGEIEMNRNAYLAMRKRACEQINDMYGLNVDVRFRSEIDLDGDGDAMDDGGMNGMAGSGMSVSGGQNG